jgi:hypothetical protein
MVMVNGIAWCWWVPQVQMMVVGVYACDIGDRESRDSALFTTVRRDVGVFFFFQILMGKSDRDKTMEASR